MSRKDTRAETAVSAQRKAAPRTIAEKMALYAAEPFGKGLPCPRAVLHTKGQPESYGAWADWAEKKSETHRQKRCLGCGLYLIWVPKT